MKYHSTLPLTALFAFSLVNLLVYWHIIPPGLTLLNSIKGNLDQFFYLLIMVIILLESIVYVGFYFPGQFFAVLLVIGAQPTFKDLIHLTLAMVCAATLGSAINYALGTLNKSKGDPSKPTQMRHLLLAMVHMNSLAFFMFAQGANHKPVRIVWLAGLINLPYYLLLITATAFMSEQVMQVAENTLLLFSLLGIWLAIALSMDIRKRKK